MSHARPSTNLKWNALMAANRGSIENRLKNSAGRAIHHYAMISSGDRLLVAVSGGKDSMTALWYLQERLHRIPITYDLIPVYLEMGYDPPSQTHMKAYFEENGFDSYVVESTDYAVRAHSEENYKNPCFFCSRLRRKRLFQLAEQYRCNKLVLGHNQDDIIETFFLNTFFGAVMSTMVPFQPMFQGLLTIIRPLAFTSSDLVVRFATHRKLPLIANQCPSAKNSKRLLVRNLLRSLYAENKKIRGNVFHALQHVDPEYLP